MVENLGHSVFEVHFGRNLELQGIAQVLQHFVYNVPVGLSQLVVFQHELSQTQRVDEVVVVGDAHADFLLLALETLLCNDSCVAFRGLKALQELLEHFLRRFLARNDIRVLQRAKSAV